MAPATEIYGASASVHLHYSGDLRALSKLLEQKFFHTEFHLDTDMDPPHTEFATCEALGFEVWLKPSIHIQGYNFYLSLQSSHCHDEIMADKMYDLSPWLKRFLVEVGGLKVHIL